MEGVRLFVAIQISALPTFSTPNLSQRNNNRLKYCALGSKNYYRTCLERQREWNAKMRTRWWAGNRGIENCVNMAHQLHSNCIDKTKRG